MKVSELMNPKGVLLYAKIDNSADALGILVELQEASALSPTAMPTTMRSATGKRSAAQRPSGAALRCPTPATRACPHRASRRLLLRRGVDWGAPDGKPVDLVFMIAVPPGSESLHLQILARLVNLLSRSDLVESLRTASNPHRFVELIAKAENACFAE